MSQSEANEGFFDIEITEEFVANLNDPEFSQLF